MEWWRVMKQRAVVRAMCAVAGVCGCLASGATPTTNLSAVLSQDAQDAANLADSSSDSPVQRSLSALLTQGAADKTAAPDARTGTAQKSAGPASASPPPTSLGESLHVAAKDLAVNTGAVDAKQYLSEEFGLDKASDANTNADGINMQHRHSDGDTANANNAPPRSAEQLKLDEEQASHLVSALVREVMPWAFGAAVVVGCVQVLRMMLAFSRRQATRKRKYRKSSSSKASRSARL